MERTWASWVGVVAVTLSLSGCVIGRARLDHPLDARKIASIQRGVTTRAEILERFGPPQEIDGRELTAFGISLDEALSSRGGKPPLERAVSVRYFRYAYVRANSWLLTIILVSFVDFDAKRDTLIVFFDGDDKVEDFAYRQDTDQLPRFGPFSR